MIDLRKPWIASRRLFLLRLLVEVGGRANESVLYSAMREGGFDADPKSELRADLDYMVSQGCLRQEWSGTLRIVELTERGEDCAYGRETVEGIEHSRWDRRS